MRAFNHLLILIFAIPFFTYCQRDLMPNWHQVVIMNHVQSLLDSPDDYHGICFNIIDRKYLESQPVIAGSLSALSDYYQDIFNTTGDDFQLPVLNLDTLNIYLHQLPEIQKTQAFEIQVAIQKELEFLDDILHEFNLSIYHPVPTDSLIVYHEYSTKTSLGDFEYQSIFEIDKESKTVLAEKILQKTPLL